MYNGFFTANNKIEVITVKNKYVQVVFKKIQSYSFIIFIALIVGAFFILAQVNRNGNDADPQTSDDIPVDNPNQPGDGTPDVVTNEEFKLPFLNADVVVVKGYYDESQTEEEQLSSIIYYGNGKYVENNGVNYTLDGETTFDVVASLSGEVIDVKNDERLGQYIEIEHLYGFTTRYYGLTDSQVVVGDMVEQGDVIASAGTSQDQDSGVHVHFEIARDGKEINPTEMIGKKLEEFKN
jgi:stage II sporulation protein Q